MEATQKVSLDLRPERRVPLDGADLAWRAYIKASQERPTVEEAPEADLGPGMAGRQRDGRSNAYAEFEVRPDTGEVLVKIIDGETGEVVRTVPADELRRSVQEGQDWTRRWRIYV